MMSTTFYDRYRQRRDDQQEPAGAQGHGRTLGSVTVTDDYAYRFPGNLGGINSWVEDFERACEEAAGEQDVAF